MNTTMQETKIPRRLKLNRAPNNCKILYYVENEIIIIDKPCDVKIGRGGSLNEINNNNNDNALLLLKTGQFIPRYKLACFWERGKKNVNLTVFSRIGQGAGPQADIRWEMQGRHFIMAATFRWFDFEKKIFFSWFPTHLLGFRVSCSLSWYLYLTCTAWGGVVSYLSC